MSDCPSAVTSGGSTAPSLESTGYPRSRPYTRAGGTVASQQSSPSTEANRQQRLYDDLYRQMGEKIGNSYEDVLFWMSD